MASLISVQDVLQGPSPIIDFFAPKYIIDCRKNGGKKFSWGFFLQMTFFLDEGNPNNVYSTTISTPFELETRGWSQIQGEEKIFPDLMYFLKIESFKVELYAY